MNYLNLKDTNNNQLLLDYEFIQIHSNFSFKGSYNLLLVIKIEGNQKPTSITVQQIHTHKQL